MAAQRKNPIDTSEEYLREVQESLIDIDEAAQYYHYTLSEKDVDMIVAAVDEATAAQMISQLYQ